MKRAERFARLLAGLAIAAAVAVPLIAHARTPLLHARMAEDGGWDPQVLHATAGKALHLRLTSDDVVHGFAVGQLDMPGVDVLPGEVADVTLLLDQPGTYTYYCTRWCGLNHWRMRGTIEVSGEPADAPQPAPPPLYVTLGLDVDAPHVSPVLPEDRPSAPKAAPLAADLGLDDLGDPDVYRASAPYDTWRRLRASPSTSSLSDQQVWDLVALIWQTNTTPEALAEGQKLYAQNCAACHGEQGNGNGVFAEAVAAQAGHAGMAGMDSMATSRPADFADPGRMLGASPAVLQGKILRGGMGTGMPMWGSIFTEDQIWDLVAFLYSFQFDYP